MEKKNFCVQLFNGLLAFEFCRDGLRINNLETSEDRLLRKCKYNGKSTVVLRV